MFDLNELPDNEGPTAGRVASASLFSFATAGGGRRAAAKAKAKKAEECDDDDDVVVVSVGRVEEEEEQEEEEEEDEQEDDDEDEDDDDDDEDKDEEDVEVEEEEQLPVFYTNGNSTNLVGQLLRDDGHRQVLKAGKSKELLPRQSFLRLDKPTPAICYTNDWQRSELITYDENDEIDTDNEVTVAALDARAILDSQIVSRLDSAVSLIVPTKPSPAAAASFGIGNPRPDKLEQRPESYARKYSDFNNFHRPHPKWEGVVLDKRGGSDRLAAEDELKFDSRTSSLVRPAFVSSSRKGKRTREDGNRVTVDTVLKLKRHARPTPTVVVAADAYDGAGPSLSMSLDHDAASAENPSFTTPYKVPSKGEGKDSAETLYKVPSKGEGKDSAETLYKVPSKGEGKDSAEREETTSLSLGESSPVGFVEPSAAVVKRAPGQWTLGSKSNLRLSSSSAPAKAAVADEVEVRAKQLQSVRRDEEVEVRAKQLQSVRRDEEVEVRAKQLQSVRRDEEVEVRAKQLHPVRRDEEVEVRAKQLHPVRRDEEVEVRAKQLHAVRRDEEDQEEGYESGIAVKKVERDGVPGGGGSRVKASEKPFWQGKLLVHGCSATDVSAYCSVDLQPSSSLWSLPPVVTIENFVNIQVFFAAAKQANVVEPVMRLKLLPDAGEVGPSFRSLVYLVHSTSKIRGRTKEQHGLSEMLGSQSGPHPLLDGSLGAAGSDYVFIASPKLKPSKEIAQRTSAKLYLVLGSSLELISSADRELLTKLFEGIDWSFPPEDNYLFGFLCMSDGEKGRFDELGRSGEAKSSSAGADVSTTEEPDVPPGFQTRKTEVVADSTVDGNGPERIDAVLEIVTSEGEDAVVERDEERSLPAGIQPIIPKAPKGHSLDSNHEAGWSEKTRERKENHGSLRHNHSPMRDDGRKDRERQRDRDRDSRGRVKEKDLRVSNKDDLRISNKDAYRYSHRSGDKSDLSKRDRLKEREGDRLRERSHRDSHRDLSDRAKSSRERMKEFEKQKDRQRDKDKQKERERPIRKRARTPESEKGIADSAKYDLESGKAKSSTRLEESQAPLPELSKESRKKIRVDNEDTNATKSEVNAAQLETDNTKLAVGSLDTVTEPVKAASLQEGGQADGTRRRSSRVVVKQADNAESLGGVEAATPVGEVAQKVVVDQADQKDQNETGDIVEQVVQKAQNDSTDEIPPGFEGQTANRLFSKPASAHSRADRTLPPNIFVGPVHGTVGEAVEKTRVVDLGAKIITVTEEDRPVEGGDSRVLSDVDERGTAPPDEHVIEGLRKDAGQVETGVHNVNDEKVEVHDRAGVAGSIEPSVSEPSYYPEERINDVEMRDEVQRPKAKPLSVRVDVEGHKYDDNEVNQDSGVPPRRFQEEACTPVYKSVTSEGNDQQSSLLGVESLSSATENGSSPDLSAEVSSETLLEGCDKETRSWLVSKHSARYFTEEFGVRIRLEDVDTKPESHLKTNQGPVDVKVFVVTEKSTETNEGKWFMKQAAVVLQAIGSRGVFSKCLWYEGPVQRYAGDRAPPIQVIVKRLKGEDGKNLEKIQEETGVMIGIVRNGIGNSSRVIGLRLKGMRKKDIQEATKQVELLLSKVAGQFLQGIRAKHSVSQDASLSKLKLDCSTSTSPSSGILTPMQKDVFAAYSPVSPVAALSPLGSFKHKMDEPSIEATFTASVTAPPSAVPDSIVNGNPTPANVGDFASQSQQSEDEHPEHPDKGRRLPDLDAKYPRPLLVSNLPERASASMLRELFEDVLKVKFGLPSSYEGVSELILDVRFSPDKLCAFVEFSSDELLLEVLKIYADNKPAFYGLTLELGSSASLNKLERMILAARTESTTKGLECSGDMMDSLKLSRSRIARKAHKSDDQSLRVSTLRSSPDSDVEVSHDRRFGGRDGTGHSRAGEKPSPLFLTELMRNSSARSIHNLFEDIIKKYLNRSVWNYKGNATVSDVRFIPSRGCAFVDLATPELVDLVLDLHTRRPEMFFHMKMEIGRRPVPLGPGEEEPVVKRPSHLGRNPLVEESHSYPSGRRARGHYPSSSPPPFRRNELAAMDDEYIDDYEDDEEDERQPIASKKRRSDPERTVYADRLPENASESMIRRIFERVVRDNMTDEQREMLGDDIITEVRYVPTKFCAFIVFVAEELTRLVLQLYNHDEEIFKNMRLKPHFHSRMEDLYREDIHDREDVPVHRGMSRDMSMDRRSHRGMEDYQNGYAAAEIPDVVHRRRNSAAHRAVAATAFKEVDRRRSVYVDRIPERLPEPTVRDLFERAMRRHRHGYRSHSVSQVTFFRDKFDPEKLCAFVELEHEDMVQELLDTYLEDEEAFSGMRVRPAIKYGH